MSDTPRTDTQLVTPLGHEGSYVWSGFSRQLERELNEANRKLSEIQKLIDGKVNLVGLSELRTIINS